jgi:hypothetical protein
MTDDRSKDFFQLLNEVLFTINIIEHNTVYQQKKRIQQGTQNRDETTSEANA